MGLRVPLVFRANAAQRAVALVLASASLLVAGYWMSLAIPSFPKLLYQLKLAQSQNGDATAFIWLSLAASCASALVAGIVFLSATLALALIEGTQVVADEHGITVECGLLPASVARMLGAGRIPWKNIIKAEKRWFCFVLQGQAEHGCPPTKKAIGFLMVDQLERLIFLIIKSSPNLKL